MHISGNTLFIPGATSGIGLALARRLREHGNTVIVGGRRAGLLDQLRDEGFGVVPIDVADPRSIEEASGRVLAEYPDLDGLITMAGVMLPEDWHAPEGFLQTAETTVTTNLLGPIRLIAAFIEHLRTRPSATIVTVSSGLAHVPLARTATYSASKAAIHALTEALRIQLADTTVQVIELVPPAVRTDLGDTKSAPHAMDLGEFADTVIGLLDAQPDAEEILVEQVHFQRYAERRGEYDSALARINRLPQR
jgi:uncharacterized oxidoreductase